MQAMASPQAKADAITVTGPKQVGVQGGQACRCSNPRPNDRRTSIAKKTSLVRSLFIRALVEVGGVAPRPFQVEVGGVVQRLFQLC